MQQFLEPLTGRIRKMLEPRLTRAKPEDYQSNWIELEQAADLAPLGVHVKGKNVKVLVRQKEHAVGALYIVNERGLPCVVMLDNANWKGSLQAGIRFNSDAGLVVFNLEGAQAIVIKSIFLRSAKQTFFWGWGASAVQVDLVSVEGEGAYVAIGDDCMLSRNVNIRNYDMHAVVDADTFQTMNAPVNILVEQHVWIGDGATVFACERIGFGTILGGSCFAKGTYPPEVAVAGIPARIVRERVTWGRSPTLISETEKTRLLHLRSLPATVAGD